MPLDRMPSTSRRVLRATARAVAGLVALLVVPVVIFGGNVGDVIDRAGDYALGFAFAGAVALYWIVYWVRRRLHGRRVAKAAEIAAAEDGHFSAAAVRGSAATLFRGVQAARDAADRRTLQTLCTPGLYEALRTALDENEERGFHHHIDVVELTTVEYMGIVNREGDGEDRVTVRICSRVRDYVVGPDGGVVAGDDNHYESRVTDPARQVLRRGEFWTLAKRADGDGWVVDAVVDDEQRRDVFGAEIVARPREAADDPA